MEKDAGINITRFIQQLDGCFNRNDMKAARACIEDWESEARRLGDDSGLLTVLNEAVGFYRRSQKKGKALKAMEESVSLVEKLGLAQSPSGVTIYINAATTLSFFGREEEGLQLYDKAADFYRSSRLTETYEYAALLNNRAGTLHGLKRYDEAEENWKEAIEILKKIGFHDGEVAISLVMLAHLTFDRAVAHGKRRFYQTILCLRKGGFDLTGKKGNGTEYQRDNGPAHEDGGAHDCLGKRHQRSEQNNKRNGPEQIDQLVNDLEKHPVFQDSARAGDGNHNAQKHADEENVHTGPRQHLDCFKAGLQEVLKMIHHIGHQSVQKIMHFSAPPPLRSCFRLRLHR